MLFTTSRLITTTHLIESVDGATRDAAAAATAAAAAASAGAAAAAGTGLACHVFKLQPPIPSVLRIARCLRLCHTEVCRVVLVKAPQWLFVNNGMTEQANLLTIGEPAKGYTASMQRTQLVS